MDHRRIVLYDGECGFCSRSVGFILRRDLEGRFAFAARDSEVGRRLQAQHGLDHDAVDSMVFLEHGNAYVRSTAALRIARGLPSPWKWLGAFLLVPRPLRDLVYRGLARVRTRLARPACPLPGPGERDRFLDRM